MLVAMRAIRMASFGVWLLVGLPVVAQGADSWQRMAQWAVAYILFAILFFVALLLPMRLTQ